MNSPLNPENCAEHLLHMTRFALQSGQDDAYLYAVRLVRKYRRTRPDLAQQIQDIINQSPLNTTPTSPLR